MGATPYPLPSSTRQTAGLLCDGRNPATYGPFGDGWGIFDIADVQVQTRPVAGGAYVTTAATIKKVDPVAPYGPFYVTFPTTLTATTQFRVNGKRLQNRSLAVTRGGSIDGVSLEQELSKLSVVLQ